MKELRDLPNLNNFEFIGIGHDGAEYPCRVLFNGEFYQAYKDGPFVPCFTMLKGWRYSDKL